MELHIEGLKKKFFTLRGAHEALKGIDLHIHDREFFVLLGPSGCGKSTLLNLIAGLEKPSEGRILFNSRPVAGKGTFMPPARRDVAMVFQNYALYPHLSVFENIAFSLRIQRMKRTAIDREVHKAAEILGIERLLSVRPRELSGGERQRVAIARAIVRRPQVFLLDEPLSNLDAQLRTSMRTELRNIHRRLGITTVYVTHDQVEAMTLGDRVAVFREGRLVQCASPENLYAKPSHPFVARFIGTPAMNLIQAEAKPSERTWEIRLGKQVMQLPEGIPEDHIHGGGGQGLLGVRPEHLRRTGNGGGIQCTVETVEFLGREFLVRISVGDRRMEWITETEELREGDEIRLDLPADKLYWFSAES